MALQWVSVKKKSISRERASLPTQLEFLLLPHSPFAPRPGVHGSVFCVTALGPQLSTETVSMQLHSPDATQVSLEAPALWSFSLDTKLAAGGLAAPSHLTTLAVLLSLDARKAPSSTPCLLSEEHVLLQTGCLRSTPRTWHCFLL